LIISLLTWYYFKTDADSPKQLGIYAGLITGLSIALFQLVLNYNEYEKIEKLKNMKIIKINEDRDGEAYYRDLIKNAVYNVDVMGVTMDRLLEDFADSDSTREEKKVLIAAVNRGVKVRLLIPKKEF